MTLLSIVVPAYNAADYLRRCLDSLTVPPALAGQVEVVVVDDGSTDATASIASRYATAYPETVRVVRQANSGHGGAVNTGLDQARGLYIKVVDSDDWLDPDALAQVLETLQRLEEQHGGVDLLISNFVYEKVERARRTAMRYRRVLPTERIFGWQDIGRFSKHQYMLMHSLIYRTELLRRAGLRLPEHTFYVDNLYAFGPLRRTHRLFYLDVDLYRYHIGRPDQSVNEAVMISRIDQQLRINRMMVAELVAARADTEVPVRLRRYLLHYLEVISAVSSIMLVRAGTPDAERRRRSFWEQVHADDPELYRRLRRSTLCRLTNLPGRPGNRVSTVMYRAAQWAVGFN